ncbi:MAG: hypothetical protein M3Y87_27125 [Myxococcota bacterium]|nr:hypothetical protein [Myxococcota bacterium]
MTKKQRSLRPHEQRALQNGGQRAETAPKEESATVDPRQPEQGQGKRGNGSKK